MSLLIAYLIIGAIQALGSSIDSWNYPAKFWVKIAAGSVGAIVWPWMIWCDYRLRLRRDTK